MLRSELLDILICPSCGSVLRDLDQNLECTSCKRRYPVEEGVPNLLVPEKPKVQKS